MSEYRSRIYSNYFWDAQKAKTPIGLDNFKSRAPYLKKIISDHFPQNRVRRRHPSRHRWISLNEDHSRMSV